MKKLLTIILVLCSIASFGQMRGGAQYDPGAIRADGTNASDTVTLNRVKTATGTAAAPAYSFSSDPDTGVYSPGADSIGFSTQAGTGTATLESSDLSTIASIFHPKKSELYITGKDSNISVGSLTAAIYLANNNKNWPASLKAYVGGNGDGVDLAFSTTQAWFNTDIERMRITNGGNVLIATSTDDGANKLQVNGGAKFADNIFVTNSKGIRQTDEAGYTTVAGGSVPTTSYGAFINLIGNNYGTESFQGGMELYAGNDPDGGFINLTTQGGNMILGYTGNVLIGTTLDDGSNRLQVSGSMRLIGGAAPTAAEGAIYFNSSDKHFYGYNGTGWVQLDN